MNSNFKTPSGRKETRDISDIDNNEIKEDDQLMDVDEDISMDSSLKTKDNFRIQTRIKIIRPLRFPKPKD